MPLFLFFLLLGVYLYGVYQNNRDASYPDRAQLQQQFEKSVQWLLDNEEKILSENNAMLWWMLYETERLSQDERIGALLKKYQQRYISIKYSVWGPLFNGPQHRRLSAYSVQRLPYYNQHFIYALNCAQDLEAELPLVAQQNQPDFCHQSEYFYRPACITHQLMGINFLSTNQCELLPNIAEVTRSLQHDIVLQLTWDIRVVDVYLQRVMMLLITGAEASVKPVWIEQVLAHQLDDGGWSGFVALFAMPSGQSFGFSGRLVSFGKEKSDFHATAQGVYILGYLLCADKKESINSK